MPDRRDFIKQTATIAAAAAATPAVAQAARQTDELGFQPATELTRMLREKEISSEELTKYFIARIERLDKQLNAVVVRDFERALTAAREADATLAKGKTIGPLHGLPMTIKESYNIAGLKTTWGFPPWADMTADKDANVVRSFKNAGALFLGKTNVPLMLGDFQSYNAIYGQTNNPWDVTRTPGGSSGGSAAALAAGLTGLESGSDIGGSIRNPAHYCGVYGHKPTWGVVPGSGHQPPTAKIGKGVDIAVVGPMARSAEDLELAMQLTAGPDDLDQPGWRLELPPPRAKSLGELRIAFWHTDVWAPADQEVVNKSLNVLEAAKRAGAKVSDTARPDIDLQQSYFTYTNLMQAASNSGVPEEVFQQNKKLADSYAPDDFSPDAVFARGTVLSHNEWTFNDRRRLALRYAWRKFFEDWDLLICPIATVPAFEHDHRPIDERMVTVNGKPQPYFQSAFWAGLSSVAGLPSTVFPTGLSSAGLPIGLQAITAEYADYTSIAFAQMMSRELGGFRPPTIG